MPTTRRKSKPDVGDVVEPELKPTRTRKRSIPNLKTETPSPTASSAQIMSSPDVRKGEPVFEGVYQWLLGRPGSRRRFALRVFKYIFWTYIIWFPILSLFHAEHFAGALYVLGGTILWLGAFFREQPDTIPEAAQATKDEHVRLQWLLGNPDSRRRFGVRVFKYMTVMYLTLMALLTLWSAQRFGWLFQGKSFYLPHHSPGQMRKTAMAFRNMFYTVASSHGFPRSAIERMILFPNDRIFALSPLAYDASAKPDLSDPSDQADAALGLDLASRVLRKIDRVFASVKPSTLFETGEAQPFVKVKGGSRALLQRTGPITLIVFPGIVSEMIETAVFSEFNIWGNSSLSAEWERRLAVCKGTAPAEGEGDGGGCDASDVEDRRFSLDHLETISQPLADLVSLASIDAPPDGCEESALVPVGGAAGAEVAEQGGGAAREGGKAGGGGVDEGRCSRYGQRLVNIVRMNAIMGSLETVGSLERTSGMYIRRLSKVFHIMGEELPNCYLVGYSRGAAVALDTIVRATGSNKAGGKAKSGGGGNGAARWAGRVRGVVSLAGVLFGTEAADTIMDREHIHGRLIEAISSAIDHIDYSHEGDLGTVAHAKEIASNTQILVEMGVELASVLAEKEVPKAMAKEFSRLGAPAPDFAVIGNMLNKFLLNTFNLGNPVSSYYDNVRKFKIVIDKVVSALVELTTEERLRWWRSHTLPSAPITYYALTATMPEPPPLKQKEEETCVGSKLDWASDSADSMALRALFYDMLGVTAPVGGKNINDGNVAADRAMFWPALTRLLNPKQVSYRNVFLGILSGHHWNIAMPSVFDPQPDPFPRKVLVEALAAFLAQEQLANGK